MKELIAEINLNLDELRIKDNADVHYKMTCLVEEFGELAEAIYFDTNVREECADNIVVLLQFMMHYEPNVDEALSYFYYKKLEENLNIYRNLNKDNIYFKMNMLSIAQGNLAKAILEDEDVLCYCTECLLILFEILSAYEKDTSKVIQFIYNSAKKLK